jgi:hypothetical protein
VSTWSDRAAARVSAVRGVVVFKLLHVSDTAVVRRQRRDRVARRQPLAQDQNAQPHNERHGRQQNHNRAQRSPERLWCGGRRHDDGLPSEGSDLTGHQEQPNASATPDALREALRDRIRPRLNVLNAASSSSGSLTISFFPATGKVARVTYRPPMPGIRANVRHVRNATVATFSEERLCPA